MKLSFPVKVFAALIGAGVIYAILAHFNLVPAAIRQASSVPTQFSVADATNAGDTPQPASTGPLTLPSTTPAPARAPIVRIETIPWNATMGLQLAVGGPRTMRGSLMEKYGVSVVLARQDDSMKSQQAQIQFANAVAKGADTPAEGPAFVIIMGDGTAQYLAGANAVLKKLGDDYRAEVVGAVGYSRGEDAFMGPQAWKDNPVAAKGALVAGVLRDGDWNIAQYWLAQNGIRNNPDPTTWDPDALNWVAVDDFTKAGESYIAGQCEDRPVVKDGRLTGQKASQVLGHPPCVTGAVTWTPGDVTIAKRKGGLVKILSTKENAYQMPAVLVGIHHWNVAHAKTVQALLQAAFAAGAQVRQYDQALTRAAQASYAVYREESASYWARYYKGVVDTDRTGQPVALGGSAVATLADDLVLFGLASGTGGLDGSPFKANYEGFGTIAKQQYPRLVAAFPPVTEAVNTQFLQALADQTNAAATATADADLPTFSNAPIQKADVVATRSWTINFETGKATFTPDAEQTLNRLYAVLLQGGGLAVEIDGHTDNTGSAVVNQALSEARANAVKTWLETKAPALFPQGRVDAHGFGDTRPVAANTTADGRAKNRRVDIVLGMKS